MLKIKQTLVILMIAILTVSLAGCASSESAGTNSTPAATGSQVQVDPEQPERVSEVYGKVKSIQGNLVSIAEMERLQAGSELTEEEKAKKRDQMQSLSEEERQKLRDSQQAFTGKTITLTVPVGIPIKIKTTGTGTGATVEDGTIASIKAGTIVSIWTEQGDPQTAEYVSISNR